MENEQPQASVSSTSDVQDRLDSLQHLLVSVLILMIIIGGTFWIFMMRQFRATSADLEFVKVQATNVMSQYQRNGPIIDDVVKKLQDFGRTNADFVPILAKYGLQPGAGTVPGAATRPSTSAPAKAPKK
jgi:hypothetical protein